MRAPRQNVNRRDLLRLRRAGSALERPAHAPFAADSSAPSDLLRACRPAMGSYFEIRIGAQTPGGIELAERALERIDELEQQLTVYQDDSEVSLLNASAHLEPVPVEPGLFRLLQLAIRIGEETSGAYDVTTGALSVAWGFVRGPKRVPDAEALARARSLTGQGHLVLDPEARTVHFDRPGLAINLGSIGKGYALDRVADLVREHWWPTSALIHGGRSSIYAVGSPPGRFGDRWEIALRNPFDPETPLGVLRLRNRGMGTSGLAYQRFEANGRTYGHILDPRTGEPAIGPASVTVVAPTAAEADALSTAFYLLGADAARDYIERHPEIGAVIVEEASRRVTTIGLSRDDFVVNDSRT